MPAGPVLPVDEATAAPHTAHREMVTELDWYKGIGTPINFRARRAARAVRHRTSASTAAVLEQHGYSEAEIAALRRDGVLHGKRRI